jgi:hypothetical protein
LRLGRLDLGPDGDLLGHPDGIDSGLGFPGRIGHCLIDAAGDGCGAFVDGVQLVVDAFQGHFHGLGALSADLDNPQGQRIAAALGRFGGH